MREPPLTKIGVFSGTFDPVHKGHVAFALAAAETAGLDKVYLLPEALPRRKQGVTHYAHRIAMLRLAIKPHPKLGILDLPDKQFTVNRTLPRLQKRFKQADLYLLIGSDVVPVLASGAWPDAKNLLSSVKLVVGLRGDEDGQVIAAQLQALLPDRKFHIVKTIDKHASSNAIRASLRQGKSHISSLRSTERYIKKNWLYASVSSAISEPS